MSYPGPKQGLARAAAQLHCNSPKGPDHNNWQQSKAMGRRNGRVRAVLPLPAHPHVPSPHTPGPKAPSIPQPTEQAFP